VLKTVVESDELTGGRGGGAFLRVKIRIGVRIAATQTTTITAEIIPMHILLRLHENSRCENVVPLLVIKDIASAIGYSSSLKMLKHFYSFIASYDLNLLFSYLIFHFFSFL
jgi:hypothetical protein